MNNYTFDPTLSCKEDEIEDVWCVSFGDIMSQLGGGNSFSSQWNSIWSILYHISYNVHGSNTRFFHDMYYHMLHIIYTGIISNVTSGIIIQPIVSFLEHIALAKSFSKREPQERILDSGQRNWRILMIWAGWKVRWSSESIKLIQLKNWLLLAVHKW